MRPRFSLSATAELEAVSAALCRAYAPAKSRRRFGPDLIVLFYLGLYLSIISLMLLLVWSRPADPLADAILNNAPSSAASPTPTPKRAPQLGDSFALPDYPRLATYVGQHSRWEDLPWTANHIGDARYVWESKHWYIWLVPPAVVNSAFEGWIIHVARQFSR